MSKNEIETVLLAVEDYNIGHYGEPAGRNRLLPSFYHPSTDKVYPAVYLGANQYLIMIKKVPGPGSWCECVVATKSSNFY
jgi:hypothetical protein